MSDELWFPQIDQENCSGCGDCVIVCPTGALALVNDKAVVTNPTACNYCADCEGICPTGAIALPFQVVWGIYS